LKTIYHTAATLIADETHCREMGKRGFCEVVYETCRDIAEGSSEHLGNLELKIAAMQLLSQLSCVDDNKDRLETTGLCRCMHLFLAWRHDAWLILSSTLRLINMSATGGGVLEQLGGPDIASALGDIIAENMKDVEIVKLALWAVMNLAIDDDNKVTFGTHIICSGVISALKLHGMDVADLALGAIINLCDHNETNKAQLAACYESIVDMLRRDAAAHLCAMCGMAIVNLTEDCPENAVAYNTKELVELLHAQLLQHDDVTEVVEQASWALHILSAEQMLMTCEQLTGITKLAYRYRKVAAVIEHLIAVLHISLCIDELPASLSSRLCAVLPEILMAQASNEVVAEAACAIVKNLVSRPSCTFQHESLQRAMLSVLMSLYESDSIVLYCIQTLHMSFSHVFVVDSIEPYFKAVLKAMRTQFLLEEVVIQCCCLLRAMSIRAEGCAEIMARYGACETAIAALENHVSDKALPHICEFISTLCERSANCYMLGTAGACEALIDALQQHDAMTTITRECCLAAIVALLKHESNGATYRETNLWQVLLRYLATDTVRCEQAMCLLTANYSVEVSVSAGDVADICRAMTSNNVAVLTPLIQYCCKYYSRNSAPTDIIVVLTAIQEAHRSNCDPMVHSTLISLAQSIASNSDADDVQQLLSAIMGAART